LNEEEFQEHHLIDCELYFENSTAATGYLASNFESAKGLSIDPVSLSL